MAKYRTNLPQISGDLFVTDGGIETTLIYRENLELPSFAAFDLLKNDAGRQALQKYFSGYAELAKKNQVGIILETATWRANLDWGQKIGYSPKQLEEANRAAVQILHDIRKTFEDPKSPIVVSGCIGPRGDGYKADARMDAEEAEDYHAFQTKIFADAGVDLVSAITMTYPEEAIGIVWAARSAGLPVVISFTVETDGRLPSGQTLKEAITEVDEATDNAVAYYMINCAHPSHFEGALKPTEAWAKRIQGVRVNASRQSHAELDQATALDAGDPAEIGSLCANLRSVLPSLTVLGGCCGTDERHIEAICQSSKAVSSS